MFYDRVVRPALFRLDGPNAEAAHERTLRLLGGAGRSAAGRAVLRTARARLAVANPRRVLGIDFPNPVGLAAGMDKDGVALPAWPAMGFGFVEVGTVTRHPQPGNPRPRLFRLPHSGALINRMGFNNAGAAALAGRLDALGGIGVPLGVSIGKSKVTPLENAITDYRGSMRALYRHADYFAINVSSPNTPGLRGLQDSAELGELLAGLSEQNDALARADGRAATPVLVKFAPDLSDSAIAELIGVCCEHGAAGLIATNTTLSRTGVDPRERVIADEPGGLSGRPLTARTVAAVRFVHTETSGSLPVIGVGGVLAADDALRLIDAGADLIQLYTGLVYSGPGLLRTINRRLADRAAGVAGR
ncbi:MAG: quinone-dependent dihydroorotate dehydrogenase [Sciscionella sp.]